MSLVHTTILKLMEIEVHTLGVLKTIAPQSTIKVSLSDGETVGHLREQLLKQYPSFQAVSSFVFVVNNASAPLSTVVQSADKVIIMSPISGG